MCRCLTPCLKPSPKTGANVSIIYVPARGCADAIVEAADAGIKLVVCITEGVPVTDMIRVTRRLAETGTRLVGPNCPGVITPGKAESRHHSRQRVYAGSHRHRRAERHADVRSHSRAHATQTWSIDLCGHRRRPVHGLGFIETLELFEHDPQTKAIVLIGEIGGTDEEKAAAFIKQKVSKPVVVFVAGQTRHPANGWDMPAQLSKAAPAPRRKKSRRSKKPAYRSCAFPAKSQNWSCRNSKRKQQRRKQSDLSLRALQGRSNLSNVFCETPALETAGASVASSPLRGSRNDKL